MCKFCKARALVNDGAKEAALVAIDELERDYETVAAHGIGFLKVADMAKVPAIDIARFDAALASIAGIDEVRGGLGFTVIVQKAGETIGDAIARALSEGLAEAKTNGKTEPQTH